MSKVYLLKLTACLTFTLICGAVRAQTISVSGTVADADAPLIGASVLVQGTTIGTVTDANGRYTIEVPNGTVTLDFSCFGYATQAVPVVNRTKIDVVLAAESFMIDEVVAIGYGVQKKSHLTGSISKIEGSSLVDMPTSDVTQALQGKVVGVTIQNNTSEVGVAPEIRVRGFGSISANNGPLIVIDGFPMPEGTDLQVVNASDIASIEVLKDASSAAIYGSRAANGVIMITTKSGDIKAPKYSVKLYQGMKYAYQLHDMMTDGEYYQMRQHEVDLINAWNKANDPSASNVVVATNYRFAKWLEDMNGSTDWQKQALRDFAGITSMQVSVSGGKKESRYYVSGNYTKDQGIMLQNEVQKVSARSKLDFLLSESVSGGVNFNAIYQKSDQPTNNFMNFYRTPSSLPVYHNAFTTALTGYSGYARGNHFSGIYYPWPNSNAEGSEGWDYGNPTWQTGTLSTSAQNNPRTIMDLTSRGNEAFRGMGSMYLQINFMKDLVFLTSNGFNYSNSTRSTFYKKNAEQDERRAQATYYQNMSVNLQSENTLTYMKDFCAHSFNFMVGFTAEKIRKELSSFEGTGFATDLIHTLNAATEFTLFDGEKLTGTGTYRYPNETMLSYLGRVNYAFDNKYLVSVAIRLDQSSLFQRGHRNAWFPSYSVGWRISEEPFFEPVTWVSALKARLSYGVTGNNRVSYSASKNQLNTSNYISGPGSGVIEGGIANTSNTLGNPNLTWEQTDEYNVGLDASFLKNRINLTLDAYRATTRALLFAQSIPSFTGFQYAWNNVGKVLNKGIEANVDWKVIRNKNIDWNLSVNFATTANKVLELGGEYQMISYGERSEYYLARVGGPITQFYGYKFLGVWNSPEEIAQNASMAGDAPGKARFADSNGDGEVTADDMVPLGDPYPDFTWALNSSIRLWNFDITILFQGVQGVTVMNGDGYYNESQRWNRSWTKNRWISAQYPGDGKTVSIEAGADNGRLPLSDYYFDNASYGVLRNATIGYTFDKKVLKKLHLNGLRLYVSGNNLFYIWSKDYRGINPEARMVSSQYANPMIRGYQRGGFPTTSTVTMGIDLTF